MFVKARGTFLTVVGFYHVQETGLDKAMCECDYTQLNRNGKSHTTYFLKGLEKSRVKSKQN